LTNGIQDSLRSPRIKRKPHSSTAGDFLYVPEGGVHGFHNESGEPASMLLLFAPAGPREAYFEALAEIAAGRQFSDEEWKDFCRRHDNYFL